MDFFFCLPIIFGCPTKLKLDGDDPSLRVCPRCSNVRVFKAKSRTWFELCWIPLVPMKSERVWHCDMCQWQVPLQQGWEPMRPIPPEGHGWQQQGWQSAPGLMSPTPAPGYAPSYINPHQK